MVVIVIIGLLATVVMINVLPSQDKAMITKARADIATLEQAMEMYRLDNLIYPAGSDGLNALVAAPPGLTQPERYRPGGYIRGLPKDPWGRPYQLAVPGKSGPFDISRSGPTARRAARVKTPTFRAGSSNSVMRHNGFTLVELMVVITVMALLAGAVVLSFGDIRGGAAEAAGPFAARLAAARDEAIVSGAPVSGWVTASGYGFERYREGRWEPLMVKPFEGANWGSGTRVVTGNATAPRARVRFDSLGMPDAPLMIRLERNGRISNITVVANGDVNVE